MGPDKESVMAVCKKCGSGWSVKSGLLAGKQRHKCKACGCHFRDGDARTNVRVAAKKAMYVLLHAMAKGSFRMVGRLLGRHHTLVYR